MVCKFSLTTSIFLIIIAAGHIPTVNIFDGDIKFNHLKFSYPSRKEQTIFNDFNLTIESGKVTGECFE